LREQVGEPVETTVGVQPPRSGLMQERAITAWLIEAGGMRGELQNRDVVQPTGSDVPGWLRRDRQERGQMSLHQIGKSETTFVERQAERNAADGLGRRLHVVAGIDVTP